jgi:hypothetical protein
MNPFDWLGAHILPWLYLNELESITAAASSNKPKFGPRICASGFGGREPI